MLLYATIIILSLIAIYYFFRGNITPYKKTIPQTFAPLTHLEIKQRKPFIWKLADEGEKAKWVYECNLLKTNNLTVLWQNKDRILNTVENTKMEFSLEYIVIYLTKLLWQIGKKPMGIIKRIQFKKYFFDYCYQNIEALVSIFNDMLDYQTRLFFLLQQTKTKLLAQEKEYTKINGDPFSPVVMPGPRYTSNIFLNLNSPKKEENTKKKSDPKTPKSTLKAKGTNCSNKK